MLDRQRAAPDVAILRLQLPANDLFQYRAGQYIEFILRDGSRRSYSMANAPHTAGRQPQLELHIRHMPGGKFTDHVFSAMKEKEILRIEGPFGSFFLREDSDKPIVLLASGTGFAPIKAIIEHMQLEAHRAPGRAVLGLSQQGRPLPARLGRGGDAQLPHLRYVPVLSEAKPEDDWHGRTGLVHQAVMHDFPNLSEHQVYACGAPVMVESAQRDFIARCGLPDDEFYADAFTSEADKHGP